MATVERKKLNATVRAQHKDYLNQLNDQQRSAVGLEKRFNRLRKRLNSLARKEDGSSNSVKDVAGLCRLIFGLQEDLVRLKLRRYGFATEKNLINQYVISFLSCQRTTQYQGECQFYGETLLNLYLDIFITLTCQGTPREIEHKPGYLKNPISGKRLELDISLEEFRLAFEFQGESHYRVQKEIQKDKIKLEICAKNKVILIPVNVSQLDSSKFMHLILNSLKDALGLHPLFQPDYAQKAVVVVSKMHMRSFKKATQRIYLAKTILHQSLCWLDQYAQRFRETQANRSPISSSTDAPRIATPSTDLSVDYIYQNLKKL